MIIYKATNIINNKCYVGQTVDTLEKRKSKHKYNAKQLNNNKYFHKAIRKYGIENFKWEILCECDDKLILNIRETMKIIVEHSHVSENGYNLTWGGESSYGYKHTKKSKQKMSNWHKGKTVSAETRGKISKATEGKTVSTETREKISVARKGIIKHSEKTKRKISNIVKSRITTSETKQKMSKSHKGHTVSDETKQKIHNTLLGHHVSKETRLKISNALKTGEAII